MYVSLCFMYPETEFQLDPTNKLKSPPPIAKITLFGNIMSMDTNLPKWAILTIRVYGEILCL